MENAKGQSSGWKGHYEHSCDPLTAETGARAPRPSRLPCLPGIPSDGPTACVLLKARRIDRPRAGTYRWMAPEVTRHEGYTKSADVFSYAMLLFELITHEVPFADRPPLQAAVAIGLQDFRPPLPPETPTGITNIICSCWRRRPATRPKFGALVAQIAEAVAALTPAQKAWLDCPRGHPVYKIAQEAATQPLSPVPAPSGVPPSTSQGQLHQETMVLDPSIGPKPSAEVKLTVGM